METATEAERKERIRKVQVKFEHLLGQIMTELIDIPLSDGIDKNSWVFAGCRQDIEKVRTRIMSYIERCLK